MEQNNFWIIFWWLASDFRFLDTKVKKNIKKNKKKISKNKILTSGQGQISKSWKSVTKFCLNMIAGPHNLYNGQLVLRKNDKEIPKKFKKKITIQFYALLSFTTNCIKTAQFNQDSRNSRKYSWSAENFFWKCEKEIIQDIRIRK